MPKTYDLCPQGIRGVIIEERRVHWLLQRELETRKMEIILAETVEETRKHMTSAWRFY